MTTVRELDRAIWDVRSKYGPHIEPVLTQSKNTTVMLIIFIIVAIFSYLMSGIFAAEARAFRTPVGTTCDEVRYWYYALGGEAGVREYGRQHSISLTADQYRKAKACLRMR